MRFICQIRLTKELFPNTNAEMAYLFMTDEEEFVDGTYEPEGGENAVILQPGSTMVPCEKLAVGPTIYKMVEQPGQERLTPEPCEFAITLEARDEPEGTEPDMEENKIGGLPGFLQGQEYPFDEPCRLLIQLDSCSVPFSINFGDAGVGYAFLNEAGDQARFLWQCC